MSLTEAEEKRVELSRKIDELAGLDQAVEKGNMDGLEEIAKLSDDIKTAANELHEFTHQ